MKSYDLFGRLCRKIQKYPSRHPSFSSFRECHQHLYSEIAPLLLVAVIPLIFVFGGSYLFQTRSSTKTSLHLKNNLEQNFVSINVLEYITVILNYCSALTAYLEYGLIKDPCLVVLCVTNNISAKNWTTHTCKKSIIG